MKREIKFRAWNVFMKTMVPCGKVKIEFNNWVEDNNWIFLQYTGLKDKNGVEIYEGNILYCEFPLQNRELVGEIVYDNGDFRVSDYKKNAPRLSELTTNHIAVIGNIQNNPELLK